MERARAWEWEWNNHLLSVSWLILEPSEHLNEAVADPLLPQALQPRLLSLQGFPRAP